MITSNCDGLRKGSECFKSYLNEKCNIDNLDKFFDDLFVELFSSLNCEYKN